MDRLIENDELEREQIERERSVNRESDFLNPNTLNGKFNGYLLFCIGLAVLTASFQMGWCIGVLNTPSDIIQDFYRHVFTERGKNITNSELNTLWSITNGLMPLGGIFGGLSSGFVADYFGRKRSLILINFLVVVTAALNIMSKSIVSYETLMAGRFITGLFSGLFSGVLPLYLSELPPMNLRGLAGTMNQLTIVIGILVTNIFGLPQIFGTTDLWPVLVGFILVPVLPGLALIFAVESPKYLFINKNDQDGAKNALMKLRSSNNRLVENEIAALADEQLKQSQQVKVKWSDFVTKVSLRRPLVVAMVIQMSQQFSGINAVIFYSTDIFKSAGLTGSWPIYATILLGFVQLIMTVVCMFIIDKAGRKKLLLIGMIGMCLFAFGLAIFRTLSSKFDIQALNYMTVVSAIAYIIFFSIGPGAIPWLITSELFKSDSRGKATSLAVFVNWVSNFIVTSSFPFIEAAISSYSFLIFGVLLILFALFMLFFVPETKNKSADEVVAMFERQYVFFGSS